MRTLTCALAVGIDAPAITWINELPGSGRWVLPSQGLAAQSRVIGFYSVGFDVHRTLPRASRHWELRYPRAWA